MPAGRFNDANPRLVLRSSRSLLCSLDPELDSSSAVSPPMGSASWLQAGVLKQPILVRVALMLQNQARAAARGETGRSCKTRSSYTALAPGADRVAPMSRGAAAGRRT